MRARTAAASLLLAAVLLGGGPLTGCAAPADGTGSAGAAAEDTAPPDPGTTEPGTTEPDPGTTESGTAGAGPAGGEAVAGTLSGTDLAWLQLMAPMNDRTLLLLDLVRDRADSPALRDFAGRLETGHRAELRRMRALLAEAGVPDTNPHEGHDMTGMVTDEELREVRGAGAGFDRTALAYLREHLAHSELLSRAAEESGSDEETVALAAELAALRAGQLAELDRLGG